MVAFLASPSLTELLLHAERKITAPRKINFTVVDYIFINKINRSSTFQRPFYIEMRHFLAPFDDTFLTFLSTCCIQRLFYYPLEYLGFYPTYIIHYCVIQA